MGRHRSLSTEISTDTQVAELSEHSILATLLYTWAIPHADDWGRLSGDPRQFKLLVCPGLDVTAKDVDVALDAVAQVGLWLRYEVNGKRYIAFPTQSWFRHQNYIPSGKRTTDNSGIPAPSDPAFLLATTANPANPRKSPQIPAESDGGPQITSSPSPSPTLSPSPTEGMASGVDGEDGGLTEATDAIAPSHPQVNADTLSEPIQASPADQPDATAHEGGAPHQAAAKKPRPANAIWDALVGVMGFAPATKPERNNWGKVVKDLKDAGATPEDVRVRAGRYVTRYGRERLTVNALVSHWSECAEDIPTSINTYRQRGATARASPEPPANTDTVDDHDPWKHTPRPAQQPPKPSRPAAVAALRQDEAHVQF